MKMYYESDVNTDALEGKTVAVMGYGSQGRAQSRNMADSGVNVIVGLRENGNSWNLAKEDGMTVKTFSDAAKISSIFYFLMKSKKKFTMNKLHLMLKLEIPFPSLTDITFTLD